MAMWYAFGVALFAAIGTFLFVCLPAFVSKAGPQGIAGALTGLGLRYWHCDN